MKTTNSKLPAVGTILVRAEAPTVRYRVTSVIKGQAARILPFRASGREVIVARLGGVLAGDGSIWNATGEVF
jgi:hypothetical protein